MVVLGGRDLPIILSNSKANVPGDGEQRFASVSLNRNAEFKNIYIQQSQEKGAQCANAWISLIYLLVFFDLDVVCECGRLSLSLSEESFLLYYTLK